jgi:hypothetical protein
MTNLNSSLKRLALMTLFMVTALCSGLCTGITVAQAQEPTAPDSQNTPQPAAVEPVTGATEQTGSVARAMFTSNVIDHEPVDTLTSLSVSQGEIYYFTELRNLAGQTVTHRWEYQGKEMAQVDFEVGSPRWRVYSIKKLDPQWTGTWTVTVTDSHGHTLQTDSIDVIE